MANINSRKQGPPEKAFLDAMKEYGIKDWENPLHYDDYMSAWRAGERPNKKGKWSSDYKHPLHPDRYEYENGRWIDTITMKSATLEDKIINDMKREDFESTIMAR